MQATDSGGDFTPSPQPQPGTVVARCYSVVDFGTKEDFYMNESKGKKRKIHITFEMPTLKHVFNQEKGPEPYVLGSEYLLSTKPKSNFAKLVLAWRGRPFTPEETKAFDPSIMLGRTAFVSFIVQVKSKFAGQAITQYTNENSYLKMMSISPVPQGIEVPAQINPTIFFDFDPMMQNQRFDLALFAKLPKWQREAIEESDEFAHFAAMGQVQKGMDLSSYTNPQGQGQAPQPGHQAVHPGQQPGYQAPQPTPQPGYQAPQPGQQPTPQPGAGQSSAPAGFTGW